jgi:hypothetical protein
MSLTHFMVQLLRSKDPSHQCRGFEWLPAQFDQSQAFLPPRYGVSAPSAITHGSVWMTVLQTLGQIGGLLAILY